MYLDQLNNVLEYDLWVTLKNEYEVKLSCLSADVQKHKQANTNYLYTGLKFAKVLRPLLTRARTPNVRKYIGSSHQYLPSQNKKPNNRCHSVFYGGA